MEAGRIVASRAKPMDNADFDVYWRKHVVPAFVGYALREIRGRRRDGIAAAHRTADAVDAIVDAPSDVARTAQDDGLALGFGLTFADLYRRDGLVALDRAFRDFLRRRPTRRCATGSSLRGPIPRRCRSRTSRR